MVELDSWNVHGVAEVTFDPPGVVDSFSSGQLILLQLIANGRLYPKLAFHSGEDSSMNSSGVDLNHVRDLNI